jgi:putative PIN family toxin of toxin-antitoxin system
MPKAVVDTVVLVRALINPFGVWGRLIFVHAEQYQLIVSPPVMAEYLEVFTRSKINQKFRRGTSGLDVLGLLDILARAQVVEIDEILPVSRDPKDDKFLATARAAGADYLVSEDEDLLVLGSHEGTAIIRAARFLDILESSSASPRS